MFVKVVFWQIYNFDRLKCCVNQLSKLLFDHYFVDKVLTFRTKFVEFFLVVMLEQDFIGDITKFSNYVMADPENGILYIQ